MTTCIGLTCVSKNISLNFIFVFHKDEVWEKSLLKFFYMRPGKVTSVQEKSLLSRKKRNRVGEVGVRASRMEVGIEMSPSPLEDGEVWGGDEC